MPCTRWKAWLRANTRYDLDVPREPDGVDAVDHFLFETQRGFCEHIASAMAVLLRSVGIPTRIVVGYGPGERNPLTGYFEVRQSDAHAWVEVWYPQAGWLPYDPTFGVPPADPSVGGQLLGAEAIAALAQDDRREGAGIREAGGGCGQPRHRRGAGAVWDAWRAVVAIAALGAAIALVRRRLRRARSTGPTDDAGRAFEDLVEALARSRATHGHPRRRRPNCWWWWTPTPLWRARWPRTPSSWCGRSSGRASRRRAKPPTETEVMRALAAAERVRELVGR